MAVDTRQQENQRVGKFACVCDAGCRRELEKSRANSD
jgi:hypothetical protein